MSQQASAAKAASDSNRVIRLEANRQFNQLIHLLESGKLNGLVRVEVHGQSSCLGKIHVSTEHWTDPKNL